MTTSRQRSISLFLSILVAASFFAATNIRALPPTEQRADAVVLVNSTSTKFTDFERYLRPYLSNFGVPYVVLNIASNSVGTNIGDYALIVVGHGQLDLNLAYLSAAEQSNITAAVSNGTGLVNFDGTLSIPVNAPRYQFIQDIFGFTYGSSASGGTVSFPATEPSSQMHYITSLHQAGSTLALRSNMTMPGISYPSNVTAIALNATRPLMAVKKFGQGRAVQWGSYDWMAVAVMGPISGLDDLVWRGMVWAARKPFVMRGHPNFVTMRIDDVAGPLDWVHTAIEQGYKPWLGMFINCVAGSGASNDLRNLVASGNVTASVHAFGCQGGSQWFYWNHFGEADWSDSIMSNNFAQGTAWHSNNNIPISKFVVQHYSEAGRNAFAGLQAWGVEFVTMRNDPGTPRTAPWLVAGPYRLYEPRQPGSSSLPLHYADFLTIPGHPELNGKFFNIVTEIRDDSPCFEWCPNNDVAASVGRGTRQLKRALDSMVLASLFTHEWSIHPTVDVPGTTPITSNNWRAILQGINSNIASYKPQFVTMDYACQYVRATKTSWPLACTFDTETGRVTANFAGLTDMDIQFNVYIGEGSAIKSISGTVPRFTNSIAASVPLRPVLQASVQSNQFALTFEAASNANYRVEYWNAPGSWFTLTNFTALSTNVTVTDPITNSQRLYRVVLPPN